MRYLDTNVLVRIITGDDPKAAGRFMNMIQDGGTNEFCILDAILVEVCFVLEFHEYKMVRADIANALRTLFSVPQFFVADITLQALSMYEKHPKLDYADCLLAATGGKDGVVTLDKDLQALLARG